MYKPNTVQIELVEGCDRQCSFCGTCGFERKIHTIKKSTLSKQCKLIAESGYNPRIALVGHGEPTLHPHFFDCVKLMKKYLPNFYFQMMTNGYLIKKDLNNICRIFEAGINDIILDEYSDNKFDADKIQTILDTFAKETGKIVNFCRMGEKCSLYGSKNPKNYRLLIVPAIDESQVAISRKLTNQCGAGMPSDTSQIDKRCTRVFRELVYRWDGNVALCCQDFRGEYLICNMMDENIKTFKDVWMHERFEAARRILYHDKRTFYPCNICNILPIRPGLLPDMQGKEEMPLPTEQDYITVSKRYPVLTKRVPRDWERETGHYANGDPIEEE